MICELSDYPPERCGITSARNVMPTGFGALTVYILYDNYPQEVAWRITHQDSDTQFYFQPYEEVTAVSRQISYPFENLPAGRYIVEFGDDQGT